MFGSICIRHAASDFGAIVALTVQYNVIFYYSRIIISRKVAINCVVQMPWLLSRATTGNGSNWRNSRFFAAVKSTLQQCAVRRFCMPGTDRTTRRLYYATFYQLWKHFCAEVNVTLGPHSQRSNASEACRHTKERSNEARPGGRLRIVRRERVISRRSQNECRWLCMFARVCGNDCFTVS